MYHIKKLEEYIAAPNSTKFLLTDHIIFASFKRLLLAKIRIFFQYNVEFLPIAVKLLPTKRPIIAPLKVLLIKLRAKLC